MTVDLGTGDYGPTPNHTDVFITNNVQISRGALDSICVSMIEDFATTNEGVNAAVEIAIVEN